MLLAIAASGAPVACRPPSTIVIEPASLVVEPQGPLRTPADGPAIPDTHGSPNHWRRHCLAPDTAGPPTIEDGGILTARMDVPAGDWLVVTLESDLGEPHTLFDGRLDTLAIAMNSWRRSHDSVRIAAPLPTLAITEPTCVGLVVTVYGAAIETVLGEHARPFVGMTLADREGALYRGEAAWLLLPSPSAAPQHDKRPSVPE